MPGFGQNQIRMGKSLGGEPLTSLSTRLLFGGCRSFSLLVCEASSGGEPSQRVNQRVCITRLLAQLLWALIHADSSGVGRLCACCVGNVASCDLLALRHLLLRSRVVAELLQADSVLAR